MVEHIRGLTKSKQGRREAVSWPFLSTAHQGIHTDVQARVQGDVPCCSAFSCAAREAETRAASAASDGPGVVL
jgi:hypothetical protein